MLLWAANPDPLFSTPHLIHTFLRQERLDLTG
jgi:hypothetical protein